MAPLAAASPPPSSRRTQGPCSPIVPALACQRAPSAVDACCLPCCSCGPKGVMSPPPPPAATNGVDQAAARPAQTSSPGASGMRCQQQHRPTRAAPEGPAETRTATQSRRGWPSSARREASHPCPPTSNAGRTHPRDRKGGRREQQSRARFSSRLFLVGPAIPSVTAEPGRRVHPPKPPRSERGICKGCLRKGSCVLVAQLDGQQRFRRGWGRLECIPRCWEWCLSQGRRWLDDETSRWVVNSQPRAARTTWRVI